jgi:hypothetical protein
VIPAIVDRWVTVVTVAIGGSLEVALNLAQALTLVRSYTVIVGVKVPNAAWYDATIGLFAAGVCRRVRPFRLAETLGISTIPPAIIV